jgi:hypothetical protein
MLPFLMEICDKFNLLLNFISHLMIFLILTYIVFHREIFNKFHSTVVWYTALASFFISVTIFIEWIFGKENTLSHSHIKILSESIFFINIMILLSVLYLNRKKLKDKLE